MFHFMIHGKNYQNVQVMFSPIVKEKDITQLIFLLHK